MDLSGTWRAIEADDELRRTFPDPELDDAGWSDVTVPGHWRSHPDFDASDGPLLYRNRFEVPPPAAGRRSWLVLDGIFYEGDVWLDGSYVGVTEGYFFPHVFEVGQALRDRSEHVLAVEVGCSPEKDKKAKRNITGVFQHSDYLPPSWNPGGIWRPVRLEETGPVRIARLRVLCPEATADRALLDIRVELDAEAATTVELQTTVTADDGRRVAEHRHEHHAAAGENRVTWRVPVEQPALWWPHALGSQPLYEVAVEVTPLDEAPSHRRVVRTGLRQVRMKHWVCTINGERLFLKGANQGPNRLALGEATAEELENDVLLARQAGLDLLRLHAHIGRPELYDAADRLGMLLWQDLPLQWGYARSVRGRAARQAREAVDLLGHHPSIALWCGHNEPVAREAGTANDEAGRTAVGTVFAQQLPTFNKTLLDGTVKRALEKADPTRPVVPHSGVVPHPGSVGTDSHLSFGWYHGDERDLPRLAAAFPRLVHFVSEFGAQAVPQSAEFMEPERWPDLDWEHLAAEHSLQRANLDRHVPSGEAVTFASWQAATQDYQAALVKHHVETLRRLKYRPTGGFCQFCFADGHPGVTWSVLDDQRVPKTAFHALTAACAPVIITADRPDAVYAAGDPIALDVHVVSDVRSPITEAVATARLSWSGGEQAWEWGGDIPPDSCVRIGTVQAMAPEVPGALTLELTLVAPDLKCTNRYDSRVESASEQAAQ
jgi:beta-mannosidase